jgi:hypothetical protein
VRLFLREASKRGYTIEDVVALLDERGITAKEAVEPILSARKTKLARHARLNSHFTGVLAIRGENPAHPLTHFPK